jgi:hypothetical protein
MATRDDWLTAYGVVYDAVPQSVDLACPHCGHRTLRLVFTGDLEREVGYASFWCDTCLRGIGISRAPIPAGAVVRDIHVPAAEREPRIPDFTLVNG